MNTRDNKNMGKLLLKKQEISRAQLEGVTGGDDASGIASGIGSGLASATLGPVSGAASGVVSGYVSGKLTDWLGPPKWFDQRHTNSAPVPVPPTSDVILRAQPFEQNTGVGNAPIRFRTE